MALEALHENAQLRSTNILNDLFAKILLNAKADYAQLKSGVMGGIDWFEHKLRHEFIASGEHLYRVYIDLRRDAYTLARASESEIIAQLVKRPVSATVTHHRARELATGESMAGGRPESRIGMYLDRLRRKITSYAQSMAVGGSLDANEFAKRLMVAFPKRRKVEIPRRTLKPLKEASHPIGKTGAKVSTDNIDQDTWDDMVDAYKDEYVPKTRGPEFVVGEPTVTGQKEWYAWEFERDMSSEFVSSVRQGQVDAANENGITDFVVVSIIDDKTCDQCCGDYGCVDFDGLLASEIEKMTGGDQDVPPYHFSCRCTMAPATDDLPEKPDDGAQEFDDWINS